jgi:hypothetical protein
MSRFASVVVAFALLPASASAFTGRFQSNGNHAVTCAAGIGISEYVECVSTDSETPRLVLRNRFTDEEPPSPRYACRGHDPWEIWTLKSTGHLRLRESCAYPGVLGRGPIRTLRERQTIHIASIMCYGEYETILCESEVSRRGFTLE